jgi:hypothetical protein
LKKANFDVRISVLQTILPPKCGSYTKVDIFTLLNSSMSLTMRGREFFAAFSCSHAIVKL